MRLDSLACRARVWLFILPMGLWAVPSFAQADSAAAREQLKQGYELKAAGNFGEALGHLQESVRLDPQPKALMNLADCEEHLGKLSDADRHWVDARDRAGQAKIDGLRDEAGRRLAVLEARMPKLLIRLAHGVPSGVTVTRDGTELRSASLGVALPGDPGVHVIEVKAAGYIGRKFEITSEEGKMAEVVVDPGAPTNGGPAPFVPSTSGTPTTVAPAMRTDTSPSPDVPSGGGSALPAVGLVTLGAGVVAAGVGVALFVSGSGSVPASCNGNNCPDNASADKLSSAHASERLGIGLMAAGGAVALTGLVMWIAAPKGGPTAKVGFAPNGVFLNGTW